MGYRHGVYASEVPTSVVSPVSASAGLPVVFGTAPIHLAETQDLVNKPVLAYTYGEAVKALGYSKDWKGYTLCEFMKSHFSLFSVTPVVLVNVLDPVKHKKSVSSATITLTNGVGIIDTSGVLLSSLVVKATDAGQPLVKNKDYTAAFNSDGKVAITALAGGAMANKTSAVATYNCLDPSMVTSLDIVGGVDAGTGKVQGLELVNQVFPAFRLVPGQILAPGWSHDPVVAAVMKAKATNINGLFSAVSLIDIDSSKAKQYTEVPTWKNNQNITDPLQVVFWPKAKLGDEVYHLSTQAAGIISRTDGLNDDLPYVSPSNKNLQANGAVTADGTEVTLGPDQAAYLNGQGIVTALNFIGGWKLWGNRTAAYPGISDVKDSFIAVKRMFNWVKNKIILTYWQKVDDPTNKRLIDTVVDSINIWLNGLTARGALLGGHIEFRKEENPVTDLLDGIIRFHVFLTPPVPAKEMDFKLEFDVNYLNALFA